MIDKEKITRMLCAFYGSKLYWFACILLSGIGVIFNIEIEVAAVMILLMSGQFFVMRDCARMFYPIAFLIMTLMNIMGENIDRAWILIVGAVPVFSGMIYNVRKYKKKFHHDSVFYSMYGVSAAITLGGVFSITREEYFAIGNLYYILFLGFGMIAVCALVYTLLDGEAMEKLRYEFIHAVCDSGIFLGGVMLYYYLLNLSEFTKTQQVVEMLAHNPFRNVAVSYYILAMPFVFFCARRKLRYMLGGVVIYGACLISGSRMGLLFGSIQFFVCMVYFIITNKRSRRLFAVVLGVLLIVVLVMKDEIFYFYLGRSEFGSGFINMDESRIELMRRSIDDFLSAPIFGRGIGYTGNVDRYQPDMFEMHWYHNFVSQIVGSLGICGIVAYSYQFYYRLKLLLYRPTSFGWLIFLMYFGVLMTGLTDTGIFTPFPTVFLLNCAFMLVGMARRNEKDPDSVVHRPRLVQKNYRDDAISKIGIAVRSIFEKK